MSKVETSIWSDSERAAWRLPADVTVSQWADMNRILDPETSAEPGPYRSSRTPYMTGVQDAFTDPEVEEIDVMSAAQVGKSTAIQNMIGYCIDQDPAPTFYIVPRESDVDYVSQKIFRPMIMLSPALTSHVKTGGARDLQGTNFDFDRMTLYFGFSGSPAELAARAIKNLFYDEPDKYPPFAGREANPIDLAFKRTVTFWDRKIVKVCTPTTKLGYINNSYSCSNKQEDYIPCQHCGEYQIWRFERLKLPKTLREPEEIRQKRDVWYECEFCGRRIREDEKPELVAAGIWLPEGRTIDCDGNIHGTPLRGKRHSGFHISALIAPFPGVAWPEIMANWFEANTEEGIALGKLMDFKNATLGEAFEETGRKIKSSELVKLKGGYNKGTVPADAMILVSGVDYHKSATRGIVQINYEVRAFGYGLKNWVVDYGWVSSFEKLDEQVLLRPFEWADPTDRAPLAVVLMLVDSGHESDDVYDYCRARPGLTIPTKGLEGPLLKPLRASDLETATERRLTAYKRRKYRGMQLILVDTYFFKNQVTSWVEPRVDDEGKIIAPALTEFYDQIPEHYLREFCNEQKVKMRDRKGNVRYVWWPVYTGAPTHALDISVLSAAAAYFKGAYKLRLPGEKYKPAAARRKKRIRLSDLQRKKRLR